MSQIEALIGGDNGMTRYLKSARPLNDHCLKSHPQTSCVLV